MELKISDFDSKCKLLANVSPFASRTAIFKEMRGMRPQEGLRDLLIFVIPFRRSCRVGQHLELF